MGTKYDVFTICLAVLIAEYRVSAGREDDVKTELNKIGASCLFPGDNEFMRRLAHVQTLFGDCNLESVGNIYLAISFFLSIISYINLAKIIN